MYEGIYDKFLRKFLLWMYSVNIVSCHRGIAKLSTIPKILENMVTPSIEFVTDEISEH